MESRTFHLGDLYGAYSGVLTSLRGPAGIEDLIEFVIGRDRLCDRQLLIARPLVAEHIARQHRWLKDIIFPAEIAETSDSVRMWCWLDKMEQRHGSEHPVVPMVVTPGEVDDHSHGPKVVAFDSDGNQIDQPLSEMPEALREFLRRMGFDPE